MAIQTPFPGIRYKADRRRRRISGDRRGRVERVGRGGGGGRMADSAPCLGRSLRMIESEDGKTNKKNKARNQQGGGRPQHRRSDERKIVFFQ